MDYCAPPLVFVLKLFAWVGAVVPLGFAVLFGRALYFPSEMILSASLGASAWLIFWLTLAEVLDFTAKTAHHAERLDNRFETTPKCEEPLEF